jgi:hypothetical protein
VLQLQVPQRVDVDSICVTRVNQVSSALKLMQQLARPERPKR